MLRFSRLCHATAALLVLPAGVFAAGVSFAPAKLDFGSAALGESRKLTATLTNDTAAVVVLTGAKLVNKTAGFSFTTTCGDSLPAGQACDYVVRFKSKALKPGKGRLEVSTGDTAFPVVMLPLSGNLYPALNDTGITGCSDAGSIGLPCPVEGFPGQDAEYGRDKTANNDKDGHAGFNFTKLDANGRPLPASAKKWSCVRDNVTGLIWEKKLVGDGTQGNQGLHDADDTYTWYSTDAANNNGFVGYPDQDDNRACFGYKSADAKTFCNTEAYVNRVNAAGWCGAKDWRMPTIQELESLVDLSIPYYEPTIDVMYFNDAVSWRYWSGSPDANDSSSAWSVYFSAGGSYGDNRGDYLNAVRLVRGGQ